MIDTSFKTMDANNDGTIDYNEYRRSGVAENRMDDYPNEKNPKK